MLVKKTRAFFRDVTEINGKYNLSAFLLTNEVVKNKGSVVYITKLQSNVFDSIILKSFNVEDALKQLDSLRILAYDQSGITSMHLSEAIIEHREAVTNFKP